MLHGYSHGEKYHYIRYIVIEAAAPSPVVRQVVPVSGADNSYNFTVTGLTADEVYCMMLCSCTGQ